MNKYHELRAEALRIACMRYPPTMSDEDKRVIDTAENFYVFLTAKPRHRDVVRSIREFFLGMES